MCLFVNAMQHAMFQWLYLLKVFEWPQMYKRFKGQANNFEFVHSKFKVLQNLCVSYYNYIKQDCNVCFACFRTYANLCLNFQLVLRWSHVIHKLAGGIESGISFWHCLFIGLSSHSSEIYFCAIAWQLLTVCQQNFMRTINTKRRCA